MPKTSAKHGSKAKRSAQKATVKRSAPASTAKTTAKVKPRARKQGGKKASAIDPRILAAIGLALEAERVAGERADSLAQPLSSWVASGRVRVSTR